MDYHQFTRFTSVELVIQRYKNGITLTRPNELKLNNETALADIFKMPFNVFLMDENSDILSANECVVKAFGYENVQDTIGKSVRNVCKRDFAQQVLANDRVVRLSEKLHILEEAGPRVDDFNIEFISFKFPWYSENMVKGIFGYSLSLDTNNTKEFTVNLNHLLMTGIFDINHHPAYTLLQRSLLNNVYLNARERDILRWMVRGKTAKDIAKIYGLSYRTIEHKIDRIKIKTRCATRAELIEMVVDSGYLIS